MTAARELLSVAATSSKMYVYRGPEVLYNLFYYTSDKLSEQQVHMTWIEINCVGNLKHMLSCSSTKIVV